ncbi:PTS sugar transporter subunit IIC [Lactococcus fujiensis]|nr:PTS sugar transporter subunit IIC [Lactococcus fujiensis]
MNAIIHFLEKYLQGPMAKLSQQRHLQAIRNGVVSALPFIIVGSIFLIIAMPPVPATWGIAKWAAANITQIMIPYRLTMYIMTIYMTFGIGYNLAKSYKIDALAAGQLSVAAFLMTITPIADPKLGQILPMANLGGQGLFMGIITSFFAVEVLRFCKEKNFTIKMPEAAPPFVSRPFEALIPVVIVIGVMALITVVFKIDLNALMMHLFAPIIKAGNTPWGIMIPIFLNGFLWAFGVHGAAVVGAIATPIWQVYVQENAAAVADGKPMPNIAPETFYQWFVYIGGSGVTLGLLIAIFIVAKSKFAKSIAKLGFIPGLFNINEPVMFGAPVVLNPLLIIPFIINPMIGGLMAYGATSLGWVGKTYVTVPWTMPAPIGAFLSTGGDWRAIILVLVNLAIATVIYIPFVKMWDQKLVQQEAGEDVTEEDA